METTPSSGVGGSGRKPIQCADPGWPGLSAWGSERGEGQELGDIQAQGKTKAEARGRGLGCSVCPNLSAGGAVGAVLGGRGAGRALKWEFIVFLKENIGFSRSGELPGCPGREGLAPFGGLGGASGRSPDAFRSVAGARKGLRSPSGGRSGSPGSLFRSSGTDFRGSSS